MTTMFSTRYPGPRNPQELTRVATRVYTGGTGSVRFSSVQIRFQIRLCVIVALSNPFDHYAADGLDLNLVKIRCIKWHK
jgi:hypothetical protein